MALASTVRIAWRNLGRSRRRTALGLSAIAIAELVLVFYEGLLNGYADYLVKAITGPLVGHVQVHAPKWRDDRALDRYLGEVTAKMAAIRALPTVASVRERLYAPTLVAKGQDGEAAIVVGVDFAGEAAGGMLDGLPLGTLPGRGQVLLGSVMAQTLEAKTGDQLALVGQAADGSIATGLYTVQQVIETQVDLVNRRGVLMGLDDARELLSLGDAAHELVVVGTDPQGAAALAEAVAGLKELAGAEVLPWRKLAAEFASLIDLMWAYEYFILLLVFVAAAAGAVNTMMMATFERTRELGMLLALGVRPRRVIGLVITEGLMLGVLGLAVGAVAGVAVVLITGRTGIDLSTAGGGEGGASLSFLGMRSSMVFYPRLSLPGLWRSGLAVVVTSLLAALWPAARAARLQPVEAMRT